MPRQEKVKLVIELTPTQVVELQTCGKILSAEGWMRSEAVAGFIIDRWLPELYRNLTQHQTATTEASGQ